MSLWTSWIGVDFDGTLVKKVDGPYDPKVIGEPIPKMVERVKAWLADGKDVRIFTARVWRPQIRTDEDARRAAQAWLAEDAINAWCLQTFGRVLPVTCAKDPGMTELWDDRAVGVEIDTGELVEESAFNRGLEQGKAFQAIAASLQVALRQKDDQLAAAAAHAQELGRRINELSSQLTYAQLR